MGEQKKIDRREMIKMLAAAGLGWLGGYGVSRSGYWCNGSRQGLGQGKR